LLLLLRPLLQPAALRQLLASCFPCCSQSRPRQRSTCLAHSRLPEACRDTLDLLLLLLLRPLRLLLLLLLL
jgi:hypothetical protein